MTKVIGQIESLIRIRETLDQKGITRFNSIGDIKKFIKNYNNEKEEAFFKIQNDVDLDIDILLAKWHELQKEYDALRSNAITSLEGRISKLNTKCISLATTTTKNAFIETAIWYQMLFFKGIKFLLDKNFNRLISLKTNKKGGILKSKINDIKTKMPNRQATISKRFTKKLNELEHIKETAYSLNSLIAGAIGENLVVKELEKLPDDFILLNDFSLEFNPPIYNRNNDDRIFSIQIDHLLITHSGIFILETKNWSKESIKNLDLRSPVEQIRRTNFALFVLLSSASEHNYLSLNNHHWGEKQIPIKNVVVMINEKPNEEFKFVKIKTLNEVNNYINYFDPIFTQSEIKRISEYLRNMNN